MSEKILTVTAENFEEEVLESALPVLVDFWRPGASTARRIEPAVEELAADTERTLIVAKVNVDEQEDLADQFGVETIPSLLLFRDGERAGDALVAPGSRDAIEEWLEDNGVTL